MALVADLLVCSIGSTTWASAAVSEVGAASDADTDFEGCFPSMVLEFQDRKPDAVVFEGQDVVTKLLKKYAHLGQIMLGEALGALGT